MLLKKVAYGHDCKHDRLHWYTRCRSLLALSLSPCNQRRTSWVRVVRHSICCKNRTW